jgi:hypothetical protein
LFRRRTDSSLGWLRLPERDGTDLVVKPPPYLPVYQRLFASRRKDPISILELGIWKGDSLEMWRDALPNATIVGLDLLPPDLDLGPRVHVVTGDQTDASLLRETTAKHAPGGFDFIIDDASHLGILTARSLQALFVDCLRPGGMYCIEDWGTGYLPNWHDGASVAEAVDQATLDASPIELQFDEARSTPMPSHDAGMVGLIKRLIDHVAGATLRYADPERAGNVLPIARMEVTDGIVILHKQMASG